MLSDETIEIVKILSRIGFCLMIAHGAPGGLKRRDCLTKAVGLIELVEQADYQLDPFISREDMLKKFEALCLKYGYSFPAHLNTPWLEWN